MKHAHKNLMIAALLAGFGLTAGAQAPAAPQGPARPAMAREAQGPADPAKMQERMARMQERMARRFAEFKQKLQLSPAQEGAWTSYITALKPSGNWKRPDRAEFAGLTTPERIDRMRQRRNERMAEIDKRGEATKVFYAALSPQQKKVFDDETARRGHGRHGHHRRG
jgi:hypothetical protein